MNNIETMREMETILHFLKAAEEGQFVENEENGRRVEVTNMTGGRYMVFDEDNEPIHQTDCEPDAFSYLIGRK